MTEAAEEAPRRKPEQVIGKSVRDRWALALYDTLKQCACGAPIPVCHKPVLPAARVFIAGEAKDGDGKPVKVRIASGLMPLREDVPRETGLLDGAGNRVLIHADPEKLERHPFRVLRRNLHRHQAGGLRCFRCGGGLSAESPGMGWPGDAADALMRAVRGEEAPAAAEA